MLCGKEVKEVVEEKVDVPPGKSVTTEDFRMLIEEDVEMCIRDRQYCGKG